MRILLVHSYKDRGFVFFLPSDSHSSELDVRTFAVHGTRCGTGTLIAANCRMMIWTAVKHENWSNLTRNRQFFSLKTKMVTKLTKFLTLREYACCWLDDVRNRHDKSPEDDDDIMKNQEKVILQYRTAKSLFPAFSVPRGAVWARQKTLCTARWGTVPHCAVRTAPRGTYRRRRYRVPPVNSELCCYIRTSTTRVNLFQKM